ncbi:MAG: DUF4835 family protein [Chitinophagaceae bacterium]
MLKKILVCLCLILLVTPDNKAQEIQARLTVLSQQVSSKVNKNIFLTLQTALINLINQRKWTKDDFAVSERIQCNFLLNITAELGDNVYKASLTVQAARPIFNSTYESPMINFIDDDVVFRYQEFQPVEFNENRIQGNDPSAANLPAVIAYYVNIILGFDYDSYALRGGDPYFQKAWNIVNNAPESRDITGWKSFEGRRNRYWLAENMNNNRFALMHEAIYNYYRSGMDIFYENEDAGRSGVLNSLNFLNTLNADNPGSMVMQFFFQGKSRELVSIFSKADNDTKTRARDILSKVDLANTKTYNEIK